MNRLTFLGRGSGFNTAEKNTSAYCREGSRLLLLDCGETVFSELRSRNLLDGVTELMLAVSHLHSDHCGSVGSLWLYCRYMLNIPLTILLPDGKQFPQYAADIRTLLRFYGADPGKTMLIPDREMKPIAGIRSLRYVPTVHAPGMQCFSFEMETEDGGIFYSADTRTTEQLEAFLKTHPSFELICMDCSENDYPGNVHLSLDRIAAVIPPELRSRVRLMHLSGPGCITKGKAMGFEGV